PSGANGAISPANFRNVWNATQGTVPGYLSGLGWTGRGADLLIQRVNVDQLFHHLVLVTRDIAGSPGYSINSASPSVDYAPVPTGAQGLDSYYLDGTVVGLWSGSILTNRFVLTSDISFTYDQGMWQAGLGGSSKGNSTNALNFGQQAKLFIGTDNLPHGGA